VSLVERAGTRRAEYRCSTCSMLARFKWRKLVTSYDPSLRSHDAQSLRLI